MTDGEVGSQRAHDGDADREDADREVGWMSGPTDLSGGAWWGALRRTVKEFQNDNLMDWAAALTYYAVLSLFPGVIVLTALVGLADSSVTQDLVRTVEQVVPGESRQVLVDAITELERSSGAAGPLAVLGLLGAVWAASGYIGAFMRAANAIYETDEGRPIWKTLPLRVGLTVTMVVLLAACGIGVVATGDLAGRLGEVLGVGRTGVLVWEIAKWPVIAVLVSLAFALLYWASPNVHHPGFRWVTPGSALAVLVWLVASVGFGVYVANFGSYNKTYGSLAAVVVFLVWLWITNIAVLLGAEFDSELARAKRIDEGHPAGEEPFLEPRDPATSPAPSAPSGSGA